MSSKIKKASMMKRGGRKNNYLASMVGGRLRNLRGDEPQRAVADRAKINLVQYGAYERGISIPSDDVLDRLAEALNCAVSDIIGDAELPTLGMSASELKIVRASRSLSERLQGLANKNLPMGFETRTGRKLVDFIDIVLGKRLPTTDELFVLAKGFNCDIDALVSGIPFDEISNIPFDNSFSLLANYIGQRIKSIRGTKSIEDVTSKAQILITKYKLFEEGEAVPNNSTLARIANALNCPISDIIGNEPTYGHKVGSDDLGDYVLSEILDSTKKQLKECQNQVEILMAERLEIRKRLAIKAVDDLHGKFSTPSSDGSQQGKEGG